MNKLDEKINKNIIQLDEKMSKNIIQLDEKMSKNDENMRKIDEKISNIAFQFKKT